MERRLVGIVFNGRLNEARSLAQRIAQAVGPDAWLAPTEGLDSSARLMGRSRLVITVGGDGTILRTARLAAPSAVPIVGVNMGRVGFMTELSPQEVLERLPAYLEGKGWIEERTMLEARVVGSGHSPEEEGIPTFHGLNDAVVARGTVSRLIHLGVRVDGEDVATYAADGIIVASPTGSTGYALAVGGPILDPRLDCLLLKPLAAHLGMNTALVLPGQVKVDITVQSEHPVVLSVDGFQDLMLADGDTVRVARSSYRARFLRAHPPSHFYRGLFVRLGIQPRPSTPLFSLPNEDARSPHDH
ncbi:MAG: NAD(+)/NADH kinase [Dehalococcoidia bacterium]|nr:NAD(+)/NADH kinase [Dehalococcoidia bacterium]MDW8119240.1 NAD(+)/NADH kinase [Chloroflexota bacterium]